MHSLIVGKTQSGKSTLAIWFENELNRRGKKTAVLDPMRDTKWKTHNVFESVSDLMEYLKSETDVFFFVDESGISIDKYDRELLWLATTSRHRGHSAFFIAHRPTQLPVTIRQQCSTVFIFKIAADEGRELAVDFGDACMYASRLQRFEFIKARDWGTPLLGRLDNGKILYREIACS